MREDPGHPPRPIPARVGRYDILLPIASGGMATVYLARNRGAAGFENQVALKLTHAHLAEHGDFSTITLGEAKLASRIRHRNVVSILDLGEDPLGLFMVMEYVEGDTLGGLTRRALASQEPVPMPIAVRILLDALAGLHAAHELRDESGSPLGVVHRDFSPHNVLVGTDGVTKLTDFGIAKAADRHGHTATGVIKGKVAYMAPEQAMGTPIDRRADVWSAGVVAWELLTMKRLFAGGDVPTLLRLVQQTPPRMTTVRPDIPPALDDAVAGALERSHGARTPTAAAFARALADACGSVVRIAELDEVAAYVAAAAGPKLLDRKRQIQSIMRLRQAIDAVAEASIAANPGGTTGYTGGEVVVSAEGDTGTGTSTVSEKTPTVAEHSSPTAVTDTTSSAELRRALPRRPGWRAIAAVGAIAVALVGVASWALRTPKPTPVASAAAAAKPAASLATPRPEPTADPTPEPNAPPPPVAASLDSVDVHANAPVSSLTLNGRVIALAVPSNEVTLERSDAEKSGAVRVVAVAVDGRRATTTLAADASALEIRFTGRSAPTAPPPSTGRTRLTLAPSPYSR